MSKAEPTITPQMMHEMEAHRPVALTKPMERWEWMAQWLNHALAYPDVPCPCCKTTPRGDICDDCTQERIDALQPNAGSQERPIASDVIAEWPEWKRNVRLTKYSPVPPNA